MTWPSEHAQHVAYLMSFKFSGFIFFKTVRQIEVQNINCIIINKQLICFEAQSILFPQMQVIEVLHKLQEHGALAHLGFIQLRRQNNTRGEYNHMVFFISQKSLLTHTMIYIRGTSVPILDLSNLRTYPYASIIQDATLQAKRPNRLQTVTLLSSPDRRLLFEVL